MLILISGVSGVGKTYLTHALHQAFGWSSVQTDTTRPTRLDEVTRTTIGLKQFRENAAKQEYFCVDEFYGHLYGSPRSVIEDAMNDANVWLKDRPLSRIHSFEGYSAGNLVILPGSESQIIERLRGAGQEDRIDQVLADYRSHYQALHGITHCPANTLIIVNDSSSIEPHVARIGQWAMGLQKGSLEGRRH